MFGTTHISRTHKNTSLSSTSSTLDMMEIRGKLYCYLGAQNNVRYANVTRCISLALSYLSLKTCFQSFQSIWPFLVLSVCLFVWGRGNYHDYEEEEIRMGGIYMWVCCGYEEGDGILRGLSKARFDQLRFNLCLLFFFPSHVGILTGWCQCSCSKTWRRGEGRRHKKVVVSRI